MCESMCSVFKKQVYLNSHWPWEAGKVLPISTEPYARLFTWHLTLKPLGVLWILQSHVFTMRWLCTFVLHTSSRRILTHYTSTPIEFQPQNTCHIRAMYNSHTFEEQLVGRVKLKHLRLRHSLQLSATRGGRDLALVAPGPEMSMVRNWKTLSPDLLIQKPRSRNASLRHRCRLYIPGGARSLESTHAQRGGGHERAGAHYNLRGEWYQYTINAASCMPMNSAPRYLAYNPNVRRCRSDGYMLQPIQQSAVVQGAHTSSLLAGEVSYWAFLVSALSKCLMSKCTPMQ